MSKHLIKFILSLLIIFSSLNILSYHTNIKLYDLLTPLNAYVNYKHVRGVDSDGLNKEGPLKLSHPSNNTILIVEYGTEIRLNKKILQTYVFQKYNSEEKAIYLLNKKNEVEKHYIDNLLHISFRLNSIPRNQVGNILGRIAGGAIAFYPSALVGFFSALLLDDALGGNWYRDGEGTIQAATCLGITAAGTYYASEIGAEIGGNLGNPYIRISLKGNNKWKVSLE